MEDEYETEAICYTCTVHLGSTVLYSRWLVGPTLHVKAHLHQSPMPASRPFDFITVPAMSLHSPGCPSCTFLSGIMQAMFYSCQALDCM
jgi:hypothetical protein